MTKKKLPVRFTGQHFTIDKVLIKDAIRQANISNQDTVLDIGAGKGFLTVHLLKIANNVVAIENDTALVEHLRKLFSDARNVQVVGCDFRNFAVPKFPFKVVSNIPYGITSDIFKILMFESLGNFLGGSIVLQLEPTQKLFSRKLYNPYTVFYHLKSATKLFSVLLASKRPLITELADKLRLKYPLLPTISPCPTMRLEAIRSIIPISCRRYPKSV